MDQSQTQTELPSSLMTVTCSSDRDFRSQSLPYKRDRNQASRYSSSHTMQANQANQPHYKIHYAVSGCTEYLPANMFSRHPDVTDGDIYASWHGNQPLRTVKLVPSVPKRIAFNMSRAVPTHRRRGKETGNRKANAGNAKRWSASVCGHSNYAWLGKLDGTGSGSGLDIMKRAMERDFLKEVSRDSDPDGHCLEEESPMPYTWDASALVDQAEGKWRRKEIEQMRNIGWLNDIGLDAGDIPVEWLEDWKSQALSQSMAIQKVVSCSEIDEDLGDNWSQVSYGYTDWSEVEADFCESSESDSSLDCIR